VTASVAEIAVRRIDFTALGAGYFKFATALGAGYFKFAAAFVAESGIGGIIGLALGALHVSLSIRGRNLTLYFLMNN
jgi:hypothetical protein